MIGVHTAESFPDEVGPDDGAENVADFIRRRTTYGSYHLLADSDSIIQLVEFGCVAYHIATHGLNEHTIGISAATQAHRWNELDLQWVDATVRNMARAAARAAEWLRREHGITVPARRISLAQALRGERGFLAHGDADPGRRTDPGDEFPWGRFLDYFADEMNGEDDMTRPSQWTDHDWYLFRQNATHSYGAGGYRDSEHNKGSFGALLVSLADDLSGPVVRHPADDDSFVPIKWALNRLWWEANNNEATLAKVIANQQALMQSQGVEVDEQALAQQIAAVLVPAVVAEVSDATEDELEAVITRVVERLRVTVD